MKISKTKTDTIIIKAQTNSEWDCVDFALLQLTKPFLDFVKKYSALADTIPESDWFYCISFWYNVEGWFLFNEDSLNANSFQINDFEYVKLAKNEIEKLHKPEQVITHTEFDIFQQGKFQFTAYAKHTGETFFTNVIEINKLK